MGSIFELIVSCTDGVQAHTLLQLGISEIKRIEDLLSEYKESACTYRINKNAGIHPVKVERETLALLLRCQKISALTQGAFDISVGPLKKKYKFRNAEFKLPAKAKLNETLDLVGFNKIIIDKATQHVFLPRLGMHISFAAIGKGYAADCVKKLWLRHGVTSGVISASGDLTSIGTRANGAPWKIGIANPDQREEIVMHIPVSDSSVATSGDYEQFFIHHGVRYSHTIHPITGFPVTGIKSVSIVSQSAELCDALATAVCVMGVDVGLHFLNQLPHVHGIIIDDTNNCIYSNDIRLHCER